MTTFSRNSLVIIFLVSIFLIVGLIDELEGAKATVNREHCRTALTFILLHLQEHAYLDHVIVKYNPRYIANCTCKLNFITRMEKSMTFHCKAIKLVDNIDLHVQLYYKYRNGFQMFLIDLHVNACDYLSKNTTSKIMETFWPKITKYLITDQEMVCPFIGRFDVVNLPVNGGFLNNMFLPVGDYMLNLTINTNSKEFLSNVKLFINIPAGKSIEDDRMGR